MPPVIEIIKLPEFHSEEESRKSLRSAWVVAVNERDRHRNRQRKGKVVGKQHLPPCRRRFKSGILAGTKVN